MTARLSTALVTKLMDTGSFKDIFANCVIDIWSGTQPATADAAATGTLLCTVTKSSGALTAETKATGGFTVAGASGSVNTITVNGIDILGAAVNFITDATATAAAVVAEINKNPKNTMFVASNVAGAVTLTAVNGLGTLPNTWVVTGTDHHADPEPLWSMCGVGVNAANGLNFGNAAAGVLSKDAAETWSGVVGTGGTAGWFRVRTSQDAGTAVDSALVHPRFDGSISTSGGTDEPRFADADSGRSVHHPGRCIHLADGIRSRSWLS